MTAVVARYLHRVWGNWFAGVQGIYTNYYIIGDTALDQTVIDVLGLKGFNSGGIGVAAYYDSRDDERMPTSGWLINANNTAFRDWIAGSENFDAYRLDTRFSSMAAVTLAVRQSSGPWTSARRSPPSICAATSKASISARTYRRSKSRSGCARGEVERHRLRRHRLSLWRRKTLQRQRKRLSCGSVGGNTS
jgi:hypothetical protein